MGLLALEDASGHADGIHTLYVVVLYLQLEINLTLTVLDLLWLKVTNPEAGVEQWSSSAGELWNSSGGTGGTAEARFCFGAEDWAGKPLSSQLCGVPPAERSPCRGYASQHPWV